MWAGLSLPWWRESHGRGSLRYRYSPARVGGTGWTSQPAAEAPPWPRCCDCTQGSWSAPAPGAAAWLIITPPAMLYTYPFFPSIHFCSALNSLESFSFPVKNDRGMLTTSKLRNSSTGRSSSFLPWLWRRSLFCEEMPSVPTWSPLILLLCFFPPPPLTEASHSPSCPRTTISVPSIWGRCRSHLSSWADSLPAFLCFHSRSTASDLHKSTNWPKSQQPFCTFSFLKASEPPAAPWFLFHLSGTWREEELMVLGS